MNDDRTPTEVRGELPTRPRGIPLWVLVVGMLLLAGVGIAALATTLVRSNALHPSEDETPSKSSAITFRQMEFLSLAAHATNAVTAALTTVARVRFEAEDLFTNDVGRRVARNYELVRQAQRLYVEEIPRLPGSAELAAKLEGIRRIERFVAASPGTNEAQLLEFNAAVQEAAVFAEQTTIRCYPVRMLLASLVEESKFRPDTRFDMNESLTLGAAIGRRMQFEVKSAPPSTSGRSMGMAVNGSVTR